MRVLTILYTVENGLYVNITNRCPCRCSFCIREEGDSVDGSESLWLEHEPTTLEVIEALKKYNLLEFNEVVFCGYGEPLVRIDQVIEICKYIRSISPIKIRINTNGLSDLLHNKPTASMLKGLVDVVSISLNAPTKERYAEICSPKFGEKSFEALLKFSKEAKRDIKEVHFSVVDEPLSEGEIEECKKLSEELDIPLRVRIKA